MSGGEICEIYALNESGRYNVILHSDKPEAKSFKLVMPDVQEHPQAWCLKSITASGKRKNLSEYCKHTISKTNKSTMQIIIPGQSVVLPIRTNACISTACGYRSHTLFVPEHSDSMTFYRSTLGKCKQKYSDPVCLWVTASHITIGGRTPMVCSENTYRNFLTPHLR